MQYSRKYDKTSETLNEVAQLVRSIEQDRVLAGIMAKRLTHDDVVDYTLRLREKCARQHREIESLKKFSRTFNKEYATDYNNCFSTAKRLFGIIRSNMSETLTLFQKFCPRVNTRGPVLDGEVQKLSVMDHSMLSSRVPYMPPLFSPEEYDPCVKEFLDELARFFQDVEDALLMCGSVLEEESIIRADTAMCLRLYDKCCDEVVERSREFIEYFGEQGFAREDSMSAEMRQVPTLQEFASKHFHMHNKNEFQLHVLHRKYNEGRADEMSAIETFLWPNDHAMARRARVIMEHFDELNPKGRQDGQTGQYKLSSWYVAVFMKWCGVKDTKKEKHFVEKYIPEVYHGEYGRIASTTVNTAKNKLLRDEARERAIWDEIDRLAEKYDV